MVDKDYRMTDMVCYPHSKHIPVSVRFDNRDKVLFYLFCVVIGTIMLTVSKSLAVSTVLYIVGAYNCHDLRFLRLRSLIGMPVLRLP